MSDLSIRLWERAEAEIRSNFHDESDIRACAKAATLAVLRELSDVVSEADDDMVAWPVPGDLDVVADDLEAVSTDGE